MRFGLLLPHFGSHADPDRLVQGTRIAEDLGFSSVWVRDHLMYQPHAFEDDSPVFYETFSTLAYIAAHTDTLMLGTAAVIPTRHPAHLAQLAATLSHLLGPNRLILGMGSGGSNLEFHAIGLDDVHRPDLVREQAYICRQLWAGKSVSESAETFTIRDGSISPTPRGDIPLLYAGGTPAAVRLAGELFDGLIPGRITLPTLTRRLQVLRELFARRDTTPMVGVLPLTSIDSSLRRALDAVDVDRLLRSANQQRFWVRPDSGSFCSAGDLQGALVIGSVGDVADQVHRIAEAGVDHLVFDLRLRFGEWEDQIRLLGEGVLPLFDGST